MEQKPFDHTNGESNTIVTWVGCVLGHWQNDEHMVLIRISLRDKLHYMDSCFLLILKEKVIRFFIY